MLNEIFQLNPHLKSLSSDIEKSYKMLVECFKNDGSLLVCGNGGSAGDADHIVGELMKGFKLKRPITKELSDALKKYPLGDELSTQLQAPLKAISLSSHAALLTAFSNDINYDMAFAQQVLGYGKKGDVLIGISTSGNSKNVVMAATVAKAIGMSVIGMTGENGGELAKLSDILIAVPDNRTWAIQDMHSPVYHALCSMVESYFWTE